MNALSARRDLFCSATVMLALMGGTAMSPAAESATTNAATAAPTVVLSTSLGAIEIELQPDKAPVTVSNFLAYVDAGFYSGTVFHRVIPGFMIQGGGMDATMREKPTRAPIVNEARNGLSNKRGTVAMARTSNPNSATAQFFVNVADNGFLNPGRDAGYAVFGRVTAGMDVVDKIVAVPTKTAGMHENVPATPVTIDAAKRK
jgi:peptidyl-prolyl cis-trans isomerase A (cyclophilin A)